MIASRKIYDVIYLALREIGVTAIGDTVDPGVSQEALLVLNMIRAEWSEHSKNYTVFDQTFTVPQIQQRITMGTSSTVVGDIPVRPYSIDKIIAIWGSVTNGLNVPLSIEPYENYRSLPLTSVAAVPSKAYIDTSFPIQSIWLYPAISPGYSIRVIGSAYLAEYENIGNDYMDPPEYFGPLVNALALSMATKFGVDLPPDTYARLQSGLGHIRSNLFNRQFIRPMPNGLVSGSASFSFLAGL
jgi:hypothetical protein